VRRIRRTLAADDAADWPDGMCPNCVTPWKCNGPHLDFSAALVAITEGSQAMNYDAPQNDMDRGAMAVLDLLARSIEYAVGEESYEENAESIRAAIATDGLAEVIARQRDSEIDFIPDDERDEFPEHLAALAADVPKTVWKP